ncbi:hypothetical protein AAFF_G00003960 [Aldrovandia affinis]|uniref:Transmembrane 4 L6 family member 4 n=1 Tax=Aldrovandia affinis TaxID=143900 RepID=A0AAD7TE18_9TELE|nr:hypothetical protein AAFF_G00003960 [Aldrovandia affinis]
MCSGSFAKCLGITLIPLAILCILCNILLFFPGGVPASNNDHITTEVWYFGGIMGSGVLMIFPALVFLGLKNNDCCGCCGNESCGKRFAMFTSIIFAGVGVAGAGYSSVISAVAINHGPKCANATDSAAFGYPFENGDYLRNNTLWDLCVEPPAHRALAPDSVLPAAGDGPGAGGAVRRAGDQRPHRHHLRGLLWLLLERWICLTRILLKGILQHDIIHFPYFFITYL